jgi:hypothetical protein|tara:strand:+ start:19042 stop:19575 length:534 start_codon:yes stop_codon:yes gene_type:complete
MANVRQYNNLITASEVVTKSFTNQATDLALISDEIITIAELAHIKPMLGLDMFEELKTQNHGGTLTTANSDLLTHYLKPALAWYVRFEVMNEIQFNTTSAGLVINSSEFSSAASAEQFNQMKSDTFRKAQVLSDDMIAYIMHDDQNNEYPLFGQDGDMSMPDLDGDMAKKMNGIIFY